MKVSDLPTEAIERIKQMRYDQLIEKHEGPWDWKSFLKYEPDATLWEADGYHILLPISRDDEQNPFETLTLIRCIPSTDASTLTVFLKDTFGVSEPKWEYLEAGRLAICEKLVGTDVYITTLYHARFLVELDNDAPLKGNPS